MKISLGSIVFNRFSKIQVLDRIHHLRMLNAGGRVITPNLHFYSVVRKNPDLLKLINSHELILCDGVPIVWLSRFTKNPIPSRIAGSDLLLDLMRYSSNEKLCVAFVGGTSVTHELVQKIISREFPQIRKTIFLHANLVEPSSILNEFEFLKDLRVAQPDIFFMGLGFPKQEQVSRLLFELFPKAWFINVGMGIKYLSGEMNRCPSILQHIGLEWTWRLLSEPKRLYRRYICEDVPTFFSLATKILLPGKHTK